VDGPVQLKLITWRIIFDQLISLSWIVSIALIQNQCCSPC